MDRTLSAYKIMWIYVMFDLPTNSKKERKVASDFRKALIDKSFDMVQLSVYARHCMGKDKVISLANQVRAIIPRGGQVDILSITDKQFKNIISFNNNRRKKQKSKNQMSFF